MSTTSGLCSRTTSAAAEPSATDATTSMSERSPRRSSSASRKTWLSSTRTRRIGWGISLSLFGGQEEWVVRLAPGLDVELEARMALPNACEQLVQLRRVRAREEGQHQPGLGEQRVGDLCRDVVEAVAGGDRLAGGDPEPGPFAHGEPVQVDVPRGDGDLAGDDA